MIMVVVLTQGLRFLKLGYDCQKKKKKKTTTTNPAPKRRWLAIEGKE